MNKILLAAVFLSLLAAPVSAGAQRVPGHAVTKAWPRQGLELRASTARAAGNAYGMGRGAASELTANSPELTGGGSFGYNTKLLEF